ncbi:unnamed protein product [Acanthoscelides obtectus]|nr:unnamed protein product [Acanthoscelides obtectus]CAK1666114.1 hypothetical protein AOBTE_LOCUS25161 [Acanthoscelides obtectus]
MSNSAIFLSVFLAVTGLVCSDQDYSDWNGFLESVGIMKNNDAMFTNWRSQDNNFFDDRTPLDEGNRYFSTR